MNEQQFIVKASFLQAVLSYLVSSPTGSVPYGDVAKLIQEITQMRPMEPVVPVSGAEECGTL